MNSKLKTERIVEALEGKKARDISVIDMQGISILADYFVICNGTSTTHIKTLSDEVEEKMNEMGLGYTHKEGYSTARWILMDYGDVVVHIFHEDERLFYNLERLWSEGLIQGVHGEV